MLTTALETDSLPKLIRGTGTMLFWLNFKRILNLLSRQSLFQMLGAEGVSSDDLIQPVTCSKFNPWIRIRAVLFDHEQEIKVRPRHETETAPSRFGLWVCVWARVTHVSRFISRIQQVTLSSGIWRNCQRAREGNGIQCFAHSSIIQCICSDTGSWYHQSC